MPDAEHLPDIPVVSPNSTRKLPWPSLLYLISKSYVCKIYEYAQTQPLIQNGGLGNKKFLHSADSCVSKQQIQMGMAGSILEPHPSNFGNQPIF